MEVDAILVQELKPFRINLKAGHYKLHTHNKNQVEIKVANDRSSEKIMPIIVDHINHIEIGGQTWKKMYGHGDKAVMEIFLPERSEIAFDMSAGVVEIDGNFKNVDAKLSTGEAILKPNEGLESANVSVTLGSIRFLSADNEVIDYQKDSIWTKRFRYHDASDINLRLKFIGGFIMGSGNSNRS